MTGRGELAHVRAGLSGDHVGDISADPGGRADQVANPRKGSMTTSIRSVISSMAWVCRSIRSRWIRAKNP